MNFAGHSRYASAKLKRSVFRHSDEMGALTCKAVLNGEPPKFQKLNGKGSFVEFVKVYFAGCSTYASAKLTRSVFCHNNEMGGLLLVKSC